VAVERERPAAGDRVVSREEPRVGADAREAGSGEVHQAQRPRRLDPRQAPAAEVGQGEDPAAGRLAVGLDEGARDVLGQVERAELAGRGVETAEAGPAEEDRLAAPGVEPVPRRGEGPDREAAPAQIGRTPVNQVNLRTGAAS
jgi:hypothetical protein